MPPHTPVWAQGVEEEQGREAAVAHQHEVAPRQPAACLQGELASDIQQRFVAATLLAAGALGGDQRGEER